MQCSGHRAKTDSALSMAAACSYTLQEYDSVHKADKYLKLGGLGSLPALIAVHESARSAVQRHITPTQCSLAKGVAVVGYSGNQGLRGLAGANISDEVLEKREKQDRIKVGEH